MSFQRDLVAPETSETAASRPEPATLNPADMAYFGRESQVAPAPVLGAATAPPPPVPRRKPVRAEPIVLADPDPDLLVGLDFESTKALLGDPVLQLEQPPAKVWAYNGGTCMFSVFFYPSMDDSVFRVLTYEMTGRAADPQGLQPSSGGDIAAVKIRDRDSPILRRCFTDLLHSRDVPDAG